jgi:hypothetical protein
LSDEDLARRGLSRETDLRLDVEGRFFAGATPVLHPGVQRAFSRWIERDAGGRYVLRNDLHYVYLHVEGAPLHARAATLSEGSEPVAVQLHLHGGEREPLRLETLRLGPDGVLYGFLRDGTWPVQPHPQAVLDVAPVLVPMEDGAPAVPGPDGPRRIPTVPDPLRPL